MLIAVKFTITLFIKLVSLCLWHVLVAVVLNFAK